MISLPRYKPNTTGETKDFYFETKPKLLDFWAEEEKFKLPMAKFLAGLTKKRGYLSVLSLGAGYGVIEWIQSRCARLERVTVSDRDSGLVQRVKDFFPELEARVIDVTSQSFYESQSFLEEFDVIQLIGLTGALDDAELFRLLYFLSQVKKPIIFILTGDWIYPAMGLDIWLRSLVTGQALCDLSSFENSSSGTVNRTGRPEAWLRDKPFLLSVIKRAWRRLF